MSALKGLLTDSFSAENKRTTFKFIQIFAFLICVGLSLVVPLPEFMTREMLVVAVIWVGVIILWILETMHLAVTGFIACFLLYAIGRIGNMKVLREYAFSGFSETTVWFVFAALILGLAMHKTGLAKTIAEFFFSKIKGGFTRVLLVYMLVALVMTYMVPSGDAVTAILCTLTLGVIALPALKDKPNIAKVLFLVPALFPSVLNKSVMRGTSAITASGMIERFSGEPIGFAEWWLYMLPAQIFLFFWIFIVLRFLFKPEKIVWDVPEGAVATTSSTTKSSGRVVSTTAGTEDPEEDLSSQDVALDLGKKKGLTTAQKKTAFWFGIGMTFWFTDIFHGIRPDVICMCMAIGLLLPKIGVLSGKDLRKDLNWMAPMFIGTAFSIVNTLEHNGMFDLIYDNILVMIPTDAPVTVYILMVVVVAIILHFITGHTSVLIATILPVILTWGKAHGLSIIAITFAFLWGATGDMLIYQSGAMMIAYAYGFFNVRELFKAGFSVTMGIMMSVLFMNAFWWPMLGFAR